MYQTPLPADEVDVMAKTLYGEARGEGLIGVEAIACTIMNRHKIALSKGDYWWGKTIKEICLKPFQFSCWNTNDPNFKKIRDVSYENPVFKMCCRVSERAMTGFLPDITNGATHYHTKTTNPAWARHLVPVEEIGNHLFYREII